MLQPKETKPQKLEIRKDSLQTLNDLQKLLRDIQCLWPYWKLFMGDLESLNKILKKSSDTSFPRHITNGARYCWLRRSVA